jgi:hypothetical protein
MQDMFKGLTTSELAAMPPFPFPKELFPPNTFPPGVQFSEESLDLLPPSVRELVETGQASSLGLMYEESSGQLEPDFRNFLAALLGESLPHFCPTPQKFASEKHSTRAQHSSSLHSTAFPPGIGADAMSQNIELLSSLCMQESVEGVLPGGLCLADLVLGNPRDDLQLSAAGLHSATDSDPAHSLLGPLRSILKAAEVASADSDVSSNLSSDEAFESGPHSADELQGCAVIEGTSEADAFEVESLSESGSQGMEYRIAVAVYVADVPELLGAADDYTAL